MKKLALILGHSEQRQGARNAAAKVTEYQYNAMLLQIMWSGLINLEVHKQLDARRFFRDRSYERMIQQVKQWVPDLAVSLHCNAYDTKAKGFEVLVPANIFGLQYKRTDLAQLAWGMGRAMKGLGFKRRTTKEVQVGGRGAPLLYGVPGSIIVESFFIDNDEDYQRGVEKRELIAMCYLQEIIEFMGITVPAPDPLLEDK